MNYVFNPVRPEYHGHESDEYLEEADRYNDEVTLQELFDRWEEGEKPCDC